jgi:exodeoxyribonuclease VII large subunit
MALKRKTEIMRLRFDKCMNSSVYKEPLQKINEKYILIDKYMKSLENTSIKKLNECKSIASEHMVKLDSLSPLKTLSRGYSITTLKATNKTVKSLEDVKSGDEVEIRVDNGLLEAIIK